jgi:hypothetical protein
VPLPDPWPGLVIRYPYLWTREAAAGRVPGKGRSPCLLAATDSSISPRFILILPITHTRPNKDTVGIEIPAKVRVALGLDDTKSWIVVSEHNVDEWPNAGLAPIPVRPQDCAYGFIPPGLFAQVKAKFLELYEKAQSAGVRR